MKPLESCNLQYTSKAASPSKNISDHHTPLYPWAHIVLPQAKELLHLPASMRITMFSTRKFSVLNRNPTNYEDHLPLTSIEQAALAIGSAIVSLFNPRRAGTKWRIQYGVLTNW